MTERSLDEKGDCQRLVRAATDRMCAAFEELEDKVDGPMKSATESPAIQTNRLGPTRGGGGVMSVMKGRVFEKVGVNISTVHGEFSEEFEEHPRRGRRPRFWASGISLVSHAFAAGARRAYEHAVYSYVQGLVRRRRRRRRCIPIDDTDAFHRAFREPAISTTPSTIRSSNGATSISSPHRDEPRGVGGIFYDYVDSGDWRPTSPSPRMWARHF